MFEGLLGNDLNIYVTTAANAIESSWATYCPTFFAQHADDTNTANAALNALTMVNGGSAASGSSGSNGGSSGGWKGAVLRGLGWLQQQLGRITGAPTPAGPPAAAAAADPKPASQFTTCLGDLYSVAWMEDAELSDLTQETLLQQYKKIKVGARWLGYKGGGGRGRDAAWGICGCESHRRCCCSSTKRSRWVEGIREAHTGVCIRLLRRGRKLMCGRFLNCVRSHISIVLTQAHYRLGMAPLLVLVGRAYGCASFDQDVCHYQYIMCC
jgi:hypothetical protein